MSNEKLPSSTCGKRWTFTIKAVVERLLTSHSRQGGKKKGLGKKRDEGKGGPQGDGNGITEGPSAHK